MTVSAPRRRRPPNLALGAAGFCTSISWQIVLPVLPLHLSHIGYSPAAIGLFVSVFSLTMGLVELQAGMIAAAIGRRWSLVGGYLVNALCLNLAAIARTRGMVAASLAAVGGARGLLVPPLQATVADSAGAETRGRAFGVFWLCSSPGALSGPAIGGSVAGHYGDRAPFVLGSLFSLAALPIVATRRVPGRAPRGMSVVDLASFLSEGPVARLGVSILLCFSLSGIWTTFLPLYASRQGLSVMVIGWIFACQGCMYALMQLPTGRLVTHERGKWLALAGIVGMGGTQLFVPLLHTAPALLAAGAVYGIGLGLLPITFATLMISRVPADRYTAAMSVYNSAIDFGLFAGPLLGAGAARINVAAPFLLALPLALIAAAMTLRTPRVAAAPAPAIQ